MLFLKTHIELNASLFSGFLIVIAFILDLQQYSTYSVTTFLLAFVIGGYAKAKYGILKTLEDRQLNVEILMILAAVGSSIIGYWAEGAILIFIFSLSGALETYTMNKSRKEITSLMEIQPESAWRVQNGQTLRVPLGDLDIGDYIVVKPGERIPVDGVLHTGQSAVDESAISGEALPVSKYEEDELFAGTVNLSGAITIEMTKPSSETLFQKIIDLVQSAQSEKSPSQQFIERFEGRYVKVVLAGFVIMLFAPHYVFGWDWNTTLYRAMVLLVVASPCALVASIMPATLAAISNGAKTGIIFKGGMHLENLSLVRAIAFDKTGTLTRGQPEVTDFVIRKGADPQLTMARIAGIETQSNHPLAKAISDFVVSKGIVPLPNLLIEDIPGNGLKALIEQEEFLVGKPKFVGEQLAEVFENGLLAKLANQGKTVTFVRDREGILAAMALKDTVRTITKTTINELEQLGVYCIMLTGDNHKTAAVIAKETGVTDYVAECMPADKVEEIKKLLKKYKYVAMTGDGINDAPALATATTGIAMGAGTDIALETADVILMKNDLSRIVYAIKLSRKMQRIVKQNIFFSVSVIILLIISNFFQTITLPIGVIGHEGSTILVILNGLRMLNRSI
ncbi:MULTISPECIES: heavy metal translocating P-type ATPase [Planococcus]|uniref:Cadmium-translocating P-type ATPase n=1 Tax=Planococcus faecalis TaxID=1598147 RepID=A0ABM6IQ08_9BACL|nr:MULTISPECIES: heavy metal translocating P-type ATPase [Planococcus]AQU78664.1 cadmium-translocating P-type ATPase [Planococcus faecalis]MDJ0332139.1 heavy metal translocating P-type ATPase [Planococcus sp. S3-L1]OHX54487.1 cadmium-translocating P-type ATPase [Planococcus faecalis]